MDSGVQSTVTREWDSVRRAAANAGAPPSRVMLIVACANDARVVPLAPGCELTIGRAAPADLRLSDPSLSRTHAHVRREGNTVALRDLGSRNGVLVGGRPVEQVVLRAGDTAVLGSVMLSIQVLEATAQPAAREAVRTPASPDRARPPAGRAEIIRKSPAMVELQRVVERVAQRTIPVLLLGETGTGKELVARAIHDARPAREAGRSSPSTAPRCPTTLIESELFGHERGAFTGADRDAPGPFEQAARRHAVPRRDRRAAAAGAGQAAARARQERRVRAVGGDARGRGRRPRRRGDPPRPARRWSRAGAFRAGPLSTG